MNECMQAIRKWCQKYDVIGAVNTQRAPGAPGQPGGPTQGGGGRADFWSDLRTEQGSLYGGRPGARVRAGVRRGAGCVLVPRGAGGGESRGQATG